MLCIDVAKLDKKDSGQQKITAPYSPSSLLQTKTDHKQVLLVTFSNYCCA